MSEELIELPPGWIEVSLENIAYRITKGTTPTSLGFRFADTGILFVKVESLSSQRINHELCAFIGTDADEALSRSRLQENDVLFSIAGTLGRVAVVHRDDLPANTNQAICIIRLVPPISSKYIAQFLSSPLIEKRIQESRRGVGLQNLNLKQVSGFQVSLSPLNEQKRIADKLDRLLARVDACRERCDRIPLILKRFRQSVLAAATSGELTEDWREEHTDIETATVLLKENRFELDDSEQDLFSLPDTWEWVALGNYAQCSRGRFSARPRNDPAYFNGEYPFIQIGDLPAEGGWITKHKQTLNEKGLSVSKKFQKGTVVIAIVGATIGNTGLLAYDMCFTDSMVGIETGDEVSNRYIEFFLRYRKEAIRQISYAGGGQPNIKLEVLNPYPLALPPLAEQYEIVNRVESLFAYADRLETRYQTARSQVDRLTPAVLDKAFRGELVPQDPNDEPASVLLEPIQQSKTETPSSSFIKPRRTMSKRSQVLKTLHEQIYQQFKTKSFDAEALSQLEGWDVETNREELFQLLDQGVLAMSKKKGRDGYTLRCINKPVEGRA